MFLGTYTPRLDDKGRLILPAKFRARLGDGLIVTKGQERCLFVYPPEEFAAIAAELRQGATSTRAARDHRRMMLAGASDETPDKQGRVTIPPPLRAYAGLDRDVAVVGAGEYVEIWDLDAWNAYTAAAEQAYADLDGEVTGPAPVGAEQPPR